MPSGLLSLLSLMASEKSTVYVVLGFSESFISTTMRFPAALISGVSICGGDITTFSVGLSTCMYSSKLMLILRVLMPVLWSSGEQLVILGGVSSYHPPSGCPILAHDVIITATMSVIRASAPFLRRAVLRRVSVACAPPLLRLCVLLLRCVSVFIVVGVKSQHLFNDVAAVAQSWHFVLSAELAL